jgi:hypothetical protein
MLSQFSDLWDRPAVALTVEGAAPGDRSPGGRGVALRMSGRNTTVPKVPSRRQPRLAKRRDPERLPVRWALIGLLAVAAGAVGFVSAGPVTAIVTACAVATAAHQLIA